MQYLTRRYSFRLHALLSHFPAVCILGPRQCGKTTFAKAELPTWRYIDFEKPSDLAQIADDAEGALARMKNHIILDEAQQLPELFPILRSFVDEKPGQKGRIVLLGSASLDLVHHVSESLAGRVAFLDMSPFHTTEVDDWQALWLRGGFPDAYQRRSAQMRSDWYENYIRTYLEQDLHRLGVNVSAQQMRKLWAMLAHVHGGLWNASELAASLGTSYHTINRYVDILEQTFLVRRLPPYYANIGKRLVKSPKIYFRDSGLLHSFLGIRSMETLDTHPKRGASWEGFIIEQLIGHLSLNYPGTEFFFWMTSTRQEVDLLIKRNAQLIPVEIKLHSSPRKSDVKGLFACLRDLYLKKGYVVHPAGNTYTLGDGVQVITLQELFSEFEKMR